MTDEEIIELFFQRNEEAIKETQKKYGSYCFKIANSILNNREDSEECLNDTWMKTWNAIPPTRPVHFSLFLAKIIRNVSLSMYKSKHARKRGNGEIELILDELEECIAGRTDVEVLYLAEELNASINKFARSLSERDCNVFVRRYFYAESIKEIARRYRISENNVGIILNRSRNKLKEQLKKEGYFL